MFFLADHQKSWVNGQGKGNYCWPKRVEVQGPRHFFSVWPNSTVGMVLQENTQALVSPARRRYMVGRVRWPGLLLPKPRLSPLASHVTGQDYRALLQRSIFTCLVCVPLRMNKNCQLLGILFPLSLSLTVSRFSGV